MFFYSSDRAEPPHVHVERSGRTVKLWLAPLRLCGCGWRAWRRAQASAKACGAPSGGATEVVACVLRQLRRERQGRKRSRHRERSRRRLGRRQNGDRAPPVVSASSPWHRRPAAIVASHRSRRWDSLAGARRRHPRRRPPRRPALGGIESLPGAMAELTPARGEEATQPDEARSADDFTADTATRCPGPASGQSAGMNHVSRGIPSSDRGVRAMKESARLRKGRRAVRGGSMLRRQCAGLIFGGCHGADDRARGPRRALSHRRRGDRPLRA